LSDLNFRLLVDDDARIYRDLRLEALKESPESFAATYEEDAVKTDADFVLRLNNDFAVGCFHGETLVGSADFFVPDGHRTKLAHKGTIAGYFVRPKYRGTKAASGLMAEILDNVPDTVNQLHLSVMANSPRALAFYKKMEFNAWGTEPKGSVHDGDYLDEIHMVRMLDD
jgi:RimJ/RimL family protein N-acetyltransferase